VDTEQQSLRIGRDQLLSIVSTFIGGARRHGDDDPQPPGRWDPVVRVTLENLRLSGLTDQFPRASGQDREDEPPDPRKIVFGSFLDRHPGAPGGGGGGRGFGDDVALNPQPLPPRYAFLVGAAQAVIRRAELLEELAGAASSDGSPQGSTIVGGYTGRFVDDWCGTELRLRWPFPEPRPRWFPHELDGVDLVVVATQFEQAAHEAFSPELRGHFASTAAGFADAGLSRLQAFVDRQEDAR
jgi:hypothetical protein